MCGDNLQCELTTRAYTEHNRWTYREDMLTHSPYMPYMHKALRNKTETVSKKFPVTSNLCVCTEHKYAEQRHTSTT